jgi:guanylate kinase
MMNGQMTNRPLFLFVGRSASGKTTIANMLAEKHGYKQVWSYTTRKQRFDGEPGHVFISEDQFNNLGELAAYTYYNGNHYGTTFQQLDESDIYVIDIPGVESLLQKLNDDTRHICIIYFDVSVYNRIIRMLDRHDSDSMIISRLLEDEKSDWYKELDSLVWHYNNIVGKNIDLYNINANNDLRSVIELVLYYMNRYMED